MKVVFCSMKSLVVLILFLLSVNIYAQQGTPPIIFEGVAVSATEFFVDSTGKANTNTAGEYGLQSVHTTNTSYLVKVTRVLKGSEYLDTGYVEVITKLSGNHLGNQGSHGPRYENYIPNLYPGIFFTELNTVSATMERTTNNKEVLQPYQFKPMKIDFNRYDCYVVNFNKDQCFKDRVDLIVYLKEKFDIDYDSPAVKKEKKKCFLRRWFRKKKKQ